MKLTQIVSLLIIMAAIASLVGSIVTSVASADDSPTMKGDNWDAVGTEWQMDATNGINSEILTYWINGASASKTVGPGVCDFNTTNWAETGQEVYTAKCVSDKAVERISQFSPVNIWSPRDVFLDRQSLDLRERWEKHMQLLGETWAKTWRINHSGTPSNRNLYGGETWSYDQLTDYSQAGHCPPWIIDLCIFDQNFTITVSSTPQDIIANGMPFSCYEVDRSGPRGHIYEYWDADGALACPVKTVDEVSFDLTNTQTLRYHDWPGAPIVHMCDNAGSPMSDWTDTIGADVCISGHWVTLNPSLADGTPNQYDIWIGQGTPNEGDVMGTDWGVDTIIDANVAPQAGANEPGTFFVNLGPAKNLPVKGPNLHFVLDEGDGIFHLDNQTFEAEGLGFDDANSQAECPECYALGDTACDDGLSPSFVLWDPLVYDENDNGNIAYGEMVAALTDYLAENLGYSKMVEVLLLYLTS